MKEELFCDIFPQICQNEYGTFHFILIIMTTSTTSTSNKDYYNNNDF